MDMELIALLGGGVSGFIMKLISSMVQAQAKSLEALVKKQEVADKSHDLASKRGGVWVRRGIVAIILFAVVIAPFILSFTGQGITVQNENSILGLFTTKSWQTLEGFVILPEIRTALIAVVGFYFGSSQVK